MSNWIYLDHNETYMIKMEMNNYTLETSKARQLRLDHAWMRVGMIAPNIPITRDENNNFH